MTTRSQDILKKTAAAAALDAIKGCPVIGVGSGSTVNCFIDALAGIKTQIEAAVPSSNETERRLRAAGIPIGDLNSLDSVPVYVDGADECNDFLSLVKGGGGALTREKIVASAAKRFVCIIDKSKHVKRLGAFPIAVEVIPMARSCVARQIVRLGGDPHYREGFTTDNGNVILDVYGLNLDEPIKMESELNNIPGVVANGIFAKRGADRVLMATGDGIIVLDRPTSKESDI